MHSQAGKQSKLDLSVASLTGQSQIIKVDFTCIMPHTVYYAYLVCITLCLGLIYWLASLYTLIWIIVKPMRSLSGYLRQYKSSIAKLKSNPSKGMTVKDGENNNEPQDVFGGLNSPDVEMLLDLLAETMGVPPALRILTLVDQEFLTAMRSQQLQQVRMEFLCRKYV